MRPAPPCKDATALNETRTLSFHHTHSGEDLTVTFKRNGRYDEEALKKLNHHLRDWRSQDSTTMDRRLFDILWEVYRDVDGKQPINIISAYRSPQTNAMLRRRSKGVARFSQHMRGHAIDFFIPGVSLSEIRAAGLRLQRGGVGFYPSSGSPFVHLDTGSVRHWPRMTHDQLAAVFPNGRTVHIPSDGNPLKGYDLAAAEIERREKNPDITSSRGSKSFLASLFSSKSNDEEDEAPANEAAPEGPEGRAGGCSRRRAKPSRCRAYVRRPPTRSPPRPASRRRRPPTPGRRPLPTSSMRAASGATTSPRRSRRRRRRSQRWPPARPSAIRRRPQACRPPAHRRLPMRRRPRCSTAARSSPPARRSRAASGRVNAGANPMAP